MSTDAHHHGPPPRERTHGAIWLLGLAALAGLLVWWFSAWFVVGDRHGRDAGRLAVKTVVQVDHVALIADRSPAVIQRGEEVYAKNCASCHGGDGGGTADARNRRFTSEPFKAPHGGGPYGFYLTLSEGWGSMPAMRGLSIEDRYAVAHFVRESIVKPRHAEAYVAADPPGVAARIPAKSAVASGEAEIDPRTVRAPRAVGVLMAGEAARAQARIDALGAWLARAELTPAERARLGEALTSSPAVLAAVADALAARTGEGELRLAGLMPAATSAALADLARRLATALPGATP